ncbi:16S rRNA (adenine(1518)-N(6)/adenine(1519)-N(6))-dimethyltransferase RsmA [Leeia aquatica]|uniref:Ribosomal RNA small subunit methyltransferase A n=1 Tax=Leeia aquatica TaxID=2725557 RepID=A0A847S958_9NEIS|nr:16S rRNA (adenine(1518)-N(6)/adenine(1519)-N(6))-dimethyltransferase RsmA [Leeia aquatica]NLR76524.1 16S rRNA (adenine(1518)-N(6)/adenine(1519)-N(6))-dimethyltransferase RsmA [Leeia aquatica]
MHTPRKRFGQHFLVDHSIIDAIVRDIYPRPGERVVEIGPGLAALTQPLLARLHHLDVVEIDRDIVARLQKQYSPDQLTIHATDALRFDFSSIGSDLRVVGNLPYNISSPLLFHLAQYRHAIRDMHFMLQKEVVDRMVAEPGSSDYGRLSVMLQYQFHLEWLLDVPPESFDPPPKVDSAVVRLIPKTDTGLDAASEARLGPLVTAAFAQRRKTVRNTLSQWFDEATLRDLGVDPGARAETLSVATFCRLAQAAT